MNIATQARTAILMVVALTLLTGILYPLVVTGSPRSFSRTRPTVV